MRRAGAAVIGAVLVFALAQPAQAIMIDHQRLESGQSFSHDYPPIPAMSPSVFSPTLESCQSSEACHVIALTLVPSPGEPTVLDLGLDWVEAREEHSDLSSNDLDFYLWDDKGEEQTHGATAGRPEQMGAADLSRGTYYIGVINWAGANTGYTLTGSLRDQEIEIYQAPASDSQPPAARDDGAERTEVVAAAPAPQAETVEPERVATPGEDGPSTTVAIGGIDDARRAQAIGSGLPLSTIVFLALTIAIGVAGAMFVVVKIKREVAAATA